MGFYHSSALSICAPPCRDSRSLSCHLGDIMTPCELVCGLLKKAPNARRGRIHHLREWKGRRLFSVRALRELARSRHCGRGHDSKVSALRRAHDGSVLLLPRIHLYARAIGGTETPSQRKRIAADRGKRLYQPTGHPAPSLAVAPPDPGRAKQGTHRRD